MGIETIYYKMWDRETQYRLVKKAKFNDYAEIESRKDVLKAVNIEVNNECFLERLRDNGTKGYVYCVQWLEGLMFEYVKRVCTEMDDDSHAFDFFIKWLDNTSFLIEREYPKLSQWCEEQKKQAAEFYKNAEQHKSNESITEEPTTEVTPQTKYSPELLALFKNHAELIDKLVGKSDDEIVERIKRWAEEKDTTGRSLIENPKNSCRLKYAQLLKEAKIINLSVESFRRKL